MKVKELIELLSKQNPEANVVIIDEDDEATDVGQVNEWGVDNDVAIAAAE